MALTYKIKPLVLTIASVLAANQYAYAAEENTQEDNSSGNSETEVIEVQGFRGSILKSISEKRNSGNISDTIFAEDIGKSTDQNIADALSRVTGVSVQERDGEGTLITVRGANPNQNVITLNGVTLTSAGDSQGVDLSAFSSDILSQISVYKSPSADHIEGSLGATISLKTSRPLNRKETTVAEVQYRRDDFGENNDYKVSASLSRKLFDETFGVFATISKETSSSRRDQIRINDYEVVDVKIAGTTDGGVVADTKALAPNSVNYDLYQNESDRVSGTLTLQYAPTVNTNILFNVTASKQSLTNSSQGVQVRPKMTLYDNFFEGELHSEKLNGQDFTPTYSDPQQDWWTVDTDTRTIVKSVNRFGDGGYNTNAGGDDISNTIVNLELEQYVTDDIKVNAGLDYSKTKQDPNTRRYYFSMLSGVSNQALLAADQYGAPHTGIQPVGYDCSTGTCLMVTGTSILSHEDRLNLWDNERTTGFNPLDTSANRYNGFTITEREVDDEIKGGFIDIDWDVDFFGITKIEAGARFNKREKFVDHQTGRLLNSSNGFPVNIYDAFGNVTGTRIITTGETLSAVPSENYLKDEAFPYDNFLTSLDVPSTSVTQGFPQVDIDKFLEIAANKDPQYQRDNSNTRGVELDNKAFYLKLNFNPIENLTGDIGVRYVKTEVLANGYSGITWPQDSFNRVFDPFLFRQLRTPELLDGMTQKDECSNTDPYSPNQQSWFNRIDGYGWDFNGTEKDPTDDVRIPAESTYPCYDPLTQNRTDHGSWARHTDWRHLRDYYSFAESYVDDAGIERPLNEKTDNSLSSFAVSDTHSYSRILPSLNLNMAFTNELIGRFATSKTMSHPQIDSIQPGFKMTHGYWGEPTNGNTRGASINLRNTKLNPQESTNLDLSLEWYFNQEGMLSLAFFHKELKDFEERVVTPVYGADLRFLDFSQSYTLEELNLTKSKEEILAEWQEDPSKLWGDRANACAPNMGSIFAPNQDWWYAADAADQTADPGGREAMATFYCSLFNKSELRNGQSGQITGLEFAYRQSYDFLPGVWSGLGVDFNYTYQSSKYESEIVEGRKLPEFPTAWAPEHSYNLAGYWQKHGHLIRVAYRGKTDELINRAQGEGALWREGSGRLDLTANYKINKTFSLSFQALNLTDTATRNYYTSVFNELDTDSEGNGIDFDEGNALDGGVTKSRTMLHYKNGRTYRVSLRANF